MTVRSVVITGATSQVGRFLLPRLEGAGIRVIALSRGRQATPDRRGREWICTSDSDSQERLKQSGPIDAAVHLAPLPLLPAMLPMLQAAGVNRLVAFGTSGRFYKTGSGDAAELAYIRSVVAAEDAIAAACPELGIAWTVFRPTLVYGAGLDRNIRVIAGFVRRFGFFPVCAGGRGLRQPVHADDLAEASVRVLGCSATFGRAYNLSGGSVISFREMVEAVFRALGRTPFLVPVPLPVFRLALSVARRLPGFSNLSTEMAARRGIDMIFDHDDATRDFGFTPRAFRLDAVALGEPVPGGDGARRPAGSDLMK